MYLRPRTRHGVYPLAQEHTLPGWVRFLLAAAAALTLAYLVWTLLLRLLGVTGSLARAGVYLTLEDRGTVTVAIDGTTQRAENGMLLFPGESVRTGPGARASLLFFDGTRLRMDDDGEVQIVESGRGEETSRITIGLAGTRIWLSTPAPATFSGSVLRTLTTPKLRFELPSGTEGLFADSSLAVFTTEGEGVEVTSDAFSRFTISEGQQWAPLAGTGALNDDPYAYRVTLDPKLATSTFVTQSRQLLAPRRSGNAPAQGQGGGSDELLTVASPQNGITVTTPTVMVQGNAGAGVARVLVNGYPAAFDASARTFSQEVSPPEGPSDFEIAVQAQDDAGITLADVRRVIRRAPAPPPETPTITTPAQAGQTYRTQALELILRGSAPHGAVGIIVNDYRLQLFDPAKGEWSYIASLALRNMHPGENTYDVVAIDAAGRRSQPARITIIQGGEGPQGVVATQTSSAASTAGAASSMPLPGNAPLQPGSLTVTLPTPGSAHTETGTGFLMIGATSPQTTTISVNDYTLQLYRAGKTTWNYIVDVGINNLRRGKNIYRIVARNRNGEILDAMTYTVMYEPR